ncbi:hypothetical protein GJ496_006047 [Pomphorhynchus laevis]|nr:hypothetical protein GJ496_006047 [Pomphorhynchus laevis]
MSNQIKFSQNFLNNKQAPVRKFGLSRIPPSQKKNVLDNSNKGNINSQISNNSQKINCTQENAVKKPIIPQKWLAFRVNTSPDIKANGEIYKTETDGFHELADKENILTQEKQDDNDIFMDSNVSYVGDKFPSLKRSHSSEQIDKSQFEISAVTYSDGHSDYVEKSPEKRPVAVNFLPSQTETLNEFPQFHVDDKLDSGIDTLSSSEMYNSNPRRRRGRRSSKRTPDRRGRRAAQEASAPTHSDSGLSRRLVALNYLKTYENPSVWIQCDFENCRKWRRTERVNDVIDIEKSNWPEEHSYDACIFSKYSRGSIVMAKLQGYDYSAAMIDDDPDLGVFYWPISWEELPLRYHVVFLADPPSRCWIDDHHIYPFTEKDAKRKRKGSINAVNTKALNLLKLTMKERLDQESFAKRFNVKIRCGYIERNGQV